MEIDLCKIDWIAVSAIATFAMVLFTWFSLRQMRKQWEDERRPNLNFCVELHQNKCYVLKISNTGKRAAFNINLNFNQEFIDNVSKKAKNIYISLQERPFTLEAGCSNYYFIHEVDDSRNSLTNKKYNKITITGKYCRKYLIKENLIIDEYITGGLIVNDELTTLVKYIKNGLIVQNDQYSPIQKSLSIIAKHLSHSYSTEVENFVEDDVKKEKKRKKT